MRLWRNCQRHGSHGNELAVQLVESHLRVICPSFLHGLEENNHSWTASLSPSMSNRWWMYVSTCVCSCECTECPLLLAQAVFKVYDKDQSGTISYDEFESISSNFPFIECFSVLDQDK